MTRIPLSFMGDSLTTSAPVYGLAAIDEHPGRTGQALQALYPQHEIVVRALGIGGNTTAQMVGRKKAMTQFEVPKIGVLYGGANDPSLSSTVNGGAATTTVIPLQSGAGQYYGVGSWVKISGERRQIASIATDTLTLATALSGAPANATPVTIDTEYNLLELALALKAAGCTRVLVHGQHMKNWSAGGDTLVAEEAVYAGLRVAQQAAVADMIAQGVDAVYVDNLAAMRALISSGAETLLSNCWSAYADNQHLNCKRTRGDAAGRGGGHDVLATNAVAAIVAKKWIKA